jgi:DNA-binding protein H-NS
MENTVPRSKFSSMSVIELVARRDELNEHLVKRRKTLETEMAHLNNSINGGKKVTSTSKRSPMAGIKVKPKYRGPKGETWAGRGVHPTWLAALLKDGHKIEEYRIGAKPAAVAAARKKIARKVARKPARKVKAKSKG